MWMMFFLVVIAGALAVYAPGYLLLRAFRVGHLAALASAPLVSLVGFNILTLAYAQMGVRCSWLSLAGLGIVLALVMLLVSHTVSHKRDCGCSFGLGRRSVVVAGRSRCHFDGFCMTAYAVFGCFVTVYVLLSNLEDPSSFVQEFDNIHHLGVVKNYLESGDWSPFAGTLYGDAAASPFVSDSGSFYPSSWLMVAALAADAVGASAALGENAANFLFVAIVFPVSLCALMCRLFTQRPAAVLCGIPCALAFSAFPWRLLLFGPLYPNLAAYALVPIVIFLFMSILSTGESRSVRIGAASLTAVGVLSLVLMQPNAVFVAAVALVPFCMYRAAKATGSAWADKRGKLFAQAAAALGFFAFSAFAWIVCLHLPFFESVLAEWWPAYTSKPQAFVDALTLSFGANVPQFVLMALVLLGAVRTLFHREYGWLTCSYALLCFMFCLDASSELPLKLWLTGFWYTDKFRIAAAAVLCAIPLASFGLSALCEGAYRLARRRGGASDGMAASAAAVFVAGAFVLANFLPSFLLADGGMAVTPFGNIRSQVERANSTAPPIAYNEDERAFVDQVKQIVPTGEMVLNQPHDGSAFAYSVDDLDVYYRYARGYEGDDERPESKVIRERLCDISFDAEVRNAVDEAGVEYVLLLDYGKEEGIEPFLFTYNHGLIWEGFLGIDDETPGFEVVLSEGDMRLYRIVA